MVAEQVGGSLAFVLPYSILHLLISFKNPARTYQPIAGLEPLRGRILGYMHNASFRGL